MKEFESNLFTIRRNVMNGVNSKVKDWDTIIKELVGKDDVTTINNIYDFVCENFSFKIEKGAEGFVYFGGVNADGTTRAYQVVDGIVDSSNGSYGYISSTDAGKLFNDPGFKDAVKTKIMGSELILNDYKALFEGIEKNGNNSGMIGYFDEREVLALNDFFSVNYIQNLECSNVNTLLSGDYKKYNADGSWKRINQYATESGNYLALDDFISSKVEEAGLAKGNVVYLVGDGLKPDSVGLLTEVPTVLNDANEKGINLSDAVTVGKNLTQNADGTYSFEVVECQDVSVYLDKSGRVTFVDLVETIQGNSTEITDFELELNYPA